MTSDSQIESVIKLIEKDAAYMCPNLFVCVCTAFLGMVTWKICFTFSYIFFEFCFLHFLFLFFALYGIFPR